jgi:DNA-binding PadR family transcriptional regulator
MYWIVFEFIKIKIHLDIIKFSEIHTDVIDFNCLWHYTVVNIYMSKTKEVFNITNYKNARHAPAFVLLFLAKEPAYGSGLLKKMEEEIPSNKLDSAILYRSLQDLEKAGALASYWDTNEPGPAKKWYRITPIGLRKLAEFKEDIEERVKNLEYFLKTYNSFEK